MSKIILGKYTLEIYGASHSEVIGCVLSGIPKGKGIDLASLQAFLDRRKSKNAVYSTTRGEKDELIVLSGITDGLTSGEEIRIEIINLTAKSSDYDEIKNTPRPSHADYAARVKYGEGYDMSGGGAFSGRMTAPLCAAGGIAKQILKGDFGVVVGAYISEIGGIKAASYDDTIIDETILSDAAGRVIPTLSGAKGKEIEQAISVARANGDSLGGVVEAVILNVKAGYGDCLFGGLEGEMSKMLFSIPAVKGVEFGAGFRLSEMCGSRANDAFYYDENGLVRTKTNNSGGINGGISNGMPITLRVALRPTPSIAVPQDTIDLSTHKNTRIEIKGRHDACIAPRAVAAVEAAISLALLEFLL